MKCLGGILIAVLVTYVIPWPAYAEDAEMQELRSRIESLEREVASIHQTLAKMQHAAPQLSTSQPSATGELKWQDKQNWRKLRAGMSNERVIAILGEPDGVVRSGGLEIWRYGDAKGYVRFSQERLYGWEEPM